MIIQEAWSLIGNQSRFMIRALEMCSALNTSEENCRLKAARICVRTNNPRYT